MGAKRTLDGNAVALAEVCKASDERTFARMRGNDGDAPRAAIAGTTDTLRFLSEDLVDLASIFRPAQLIRNRLITQAA